MKRYGHAQLNAVKTTVRRGARVYIVLTCGHEKLHNPRIKVPHQAYCYECGQAD